MTRQKWCIVQHNKHYLISPLEVFYFESVDNRTFLYTEPQVLEIRKRLYELEEILSDKDFVRTSKSQLVNINKIKLLISIVDLTKTIVWTVGGVFIFCVAFTRLFIRRVGFTERLTIFMAAITFHEILFFYNIGLFADTSYLHQWLLFFAIVFSAFSVAVTMLIIEIIFVIALFVEVHKLNAFRQ